MKRASHAGRTLKPHGGTQTAYVIRRSWRHPRGAYQGFFILWKDADPDIPILKEAKKEYAKLQ